MLDRMSPRLFNEWWAYHDLEPFGEDWAQTGMTCSLIANTMGGKKKGGGHWKPADFMPLPPVKVDPEKKSQAEAQQWIAWAKAMQSLGKAKANSGIKAPYRVISSEDDLSEVSPSPPHGTLLVPTSDS